MKITRAWIDDPSLQGQLELPQLVVEVTELPDMTIQTESYSDGWSVGKYGPFVKYSLDKEVDAGDFNIRFRNDFPVVVDIALQVEGEGEPYLEYSLPLTRARQLIRKHDPTWRLLISDRDASESGALLWVPVQSRPGCRYWDGRNCCMQQPTRPVRINSMDLPLCETHVKQHNKGYAQRRAARAS